MAFESLLFSHFEETTGTFSVFLFCSSNKPFVPDTSDTKIFSQKGLSFTPSYLRIYEDGNTVLRDVKEVNNMAESIFMKAEEVARFLGVSKTEAYRIIKRLNTELKENGYMVISGRVSRRYLEEQVYGYRGCTGIDSLSEEQEV